MYSTIFISGKIGITTPYNFPSSDQKFWVVFRCQGEMLFTLFGKHILSYSDLKKLQFSVGACLQKLISDPDKYMLLNVTGADVKEDK